MPYNQSPAAPSSASLLEPVKPCRELLAAMQTLLPGSLAQKDVTRISNALTHIAQECSRPQPQPGQGFVLMLAAAEPVLPLLATLVFSSYSSFYDPFAGSGTIHLWGFPRGRLHSP
jgi:hypothetical protein